VIWPATATPVTRSSTIVTSGPAASSENDSPVFQWTPLTGAQYTLILDNESTRKVVLNVSVTGASYKLTAAQSLAAGSYTWYVVAQSGGATIYSSSKNFTVTPLTAPTLSGPGGTIAAAAGYDMPTFSWSNTGANHYALIVYDVTAGNKVVVNDSALTTNAFTLGAAQALTPGHKYLWEVASASSAGVAKYSATRTFTLAALVVPPPTGPVGSIATTLPLFTWAPVAGASYYAVIVVDTTTGKPVTVIDDTNVAGTSFTPSTPLIVGHTYTWQFAAVSDAGEVFWSSKLTFKVL
jgi:hypothetical protein